MENLDPEIRSKPGGLDSRKIINPKNLSLRNKSRDNKSSVREPDDPDKNLKRIKSLTLPENSASTSSPERSNDVGLTGKDDSLCDFRSPIKENEMNESLADFIVKPTFLKSHKRLARKDSKSVASKKRRNRDVPVNVNQPSIESSFFRPQSEVKTAFLCPLCLKSYKDATAQRNHMKSCAAKNKIPTDKLLDAVQLQEKQANERKALGLLAAPPIQPKKTISKKLISDKDPQLQLALALSMSLHEAQVTEEIEDAHLLAGEPCFSINSEMTEERRKTLQNFGFTTNKPATVSTTGRSRKKRPAGPTLLQTRTQEERDRFLTVKIAEVLMGDEAITQALLENVEKAIESEEKIILKSRLLRSYHCVENRLWDKTQQSLAGQSSYSCNLVEISPSKVKTEPEIKEPEPGPSKLETSIPGTSNAPGTVNEISVPAPIKLRSASENSTSDNKEATVVKRKVNENSAMDLSKDWRCMLGASYMSDVSVIVKGDTEIHAHQVVFWARCYAILDDVTRHDPERFWEKQQRLLWPETEVFSAYAFLEFVYCGVIERHVSIFDHPDMLAGVRALARKYRLKKLFTYLRDKSNELKSEKDDTSNQRLSEVEKNPESKLDENSNDNSSNLSEEESSISSVETDINSLSTACDYVTTNKPVIAERTSDGDNLSRKSLTSTNIKQKENISHNLVVDCFSSSNDSSASQIPTTSTSTQVTNERLSGRRMSQRISTNVATAFADITDNKNLRRSNMLSSRTNYDAVYDNDSIAKLTNKTLEEERCTSPDLFDDSVSVSSAHTYTVSADRRFDPEQIASLSDTDIEVVCTSSNNFEIEESLDSNERSDRTADMLGDNHCGKSKKPEVDCTFVSTRRRPRSFKPHSSNVANPNLECDDLNQEKAVSGSTLKQKGDITMAIERLRRLNAKTASESDSDCESVETIPVKRHKNPFRVNLTDTSSTFEEIGKDSSHSGLNDNEVPVRRRNKLSIFEKKIELEAAKNPAMYNLPTYKPSSDVYSKQKRSIDSLESEPSTSKLQNLESHRQQCNVDGEERIEPSQNRSSKLDDTIDAIFDLTQESSRESKSDSDEDTCNTNIEDQDLSMFTRYKRKHSHNSIDKYRAALKNISLQTSVSSVKDTDAVLSSDDLRSSNDESADTNTKTNRNNLSSKYEYTDPNQSTSNLHKELSNKFLKGKEETNIPPESLNSSDSDENEHNSVKLDDDELSDLEIDLSDFSNTKSSSQFRNSRSNNKSHDVSMSKRKSGNGSLNDSQTANDTCGGIDSFNDIQLEDTEFTIMKNDSGKRETNISDQDTDTECCTASTSHSKQSKSVDKIESRLDADEDKSSDIYNEETDTGEMEDRHHQPRHSRSGIEKHTMPDTVSKEIPTANEILSPEHGNSGIFSPPSINLDFLANVSNEVDDLLDECKMSSQRLRDSLISPTDRNHQATSSDSFALASTPRIPKDDLNKTDLLNEVSDSEFEDIEFVVRRNSTGSNPRNNKLENAKSSGVKAGEKRVNQTSDEEYYILESDSSNSGGSNIYKNNRSPKISLSNRSKAIRKRSGQSRCDNVTAGTSSRSSLRTLKVKSVSENVITTKSKSGANFLDDSFDRELARVRTPPIEERNTSGNNDQKTPQQEAPSANVTPLANYSAMKTPELRKELQKYGLKAQKRHRAKQLLRYIYNELHPLVPVGDKNIGTHSNESSSEDDSPAPKRLNRSKSFDAINGRKNTGDVESDCETLASDTRTGSDESNAYEALENHDIPTSSQSNNSESVESVFRKLIEVDKSLHNKILAYEPLNLEELHSTLKAQGLKCNLNALMDFLDEQCITFRTLANARKNRTRRKVSPKKSKVRSEPRKM